MSALFQPTKKGIPRFDVEQLAMQVEDNYGLKGKYSPLPSYYDQNYLLESVLGNFVIKISNNSRPNQMIEFENKVMTGLAKNGFPMQRIVKSNKNTDLI